MKVKFAIILISAVILIIVCWSLFSIPLRSSDQGTFKSSRLIALNQIDRVATEPQKVFTQNQKTEVAEKNTAILTTQIKEIENIQAKVQDIYNRTNYNHAKMTTKEYEESILLLKEYNRRMHDLLKEVQKEERL